MNAAAALMRRRFSVAARLSGTEVHCYISKDQEPYA